MLNVKQGGIKYHFFSFWYDSTWDWTPNPFVTTLHSFPTQICISIFPFLFFFSLSLSLSLSLSPLSLSLLLSVPPSCLSISSNCFALQNNQHSDEVFHEIKTKYQYESIVCVLIYPLFHFFFFHILSDFSNLLFHYFVEMDNHTFNKTLQLQRIYHCSSLP